MRSRDKIIILPDGLEIIRVRYNFQTLKVGTNPYVIWAMWYYNVCSLLCLAAPSWLVTRRKLSFCHPRSSKDVLIEYIQ